MRLLRLNEGFINRLPVTVGRWENLSLAIVRVIHRTRGKPSRMRVWHPRAPALRFARQPPRPRRARACPSPSSAHSTARGGNPLGCAYGIRGPPRYGEKNGTLSLAIVRVIQRSRGTGPRATVCQAASLSLAIVRVIHRSRGKPARMRVWHPRAPALREHQAPRSLLPGSPSANAGRGKPLNHPT